MIQEPLFLVVEDDLNIAKQVLGTLERMGFDNLKFATSLLQAHQACEPTLPDVAILDICLGFGVDTLNFGRSLERRNVQVIYLSGYCESDFERPIGGIAFMQKPFTRRMLEDSVRVALQPADAACA